MANVSLVPVGQKRFFEMAGNQASVVNVVGTAGGFELWILSSDGVRYVLKTQRNTIRRYKSASALFNFLKDKGIDNVAVDSLTECPLDSFIRNNRNKKKTETSCGEAKL